MRTALRGKQYHAAEEESGYRRAGKQEKRTGIRRIKCTPTTMKGIPAYNTAYQEDKERAI